MENTAFTWHQPGYPTYQELDWWRDGLIAVVTIAEYDHGYCGDVGYTTTKTLCRFAVVRDLLETGSHEALATEFARCWEQNPQEAANWIRRGKANADGRRPDYLPNAEFNLERPGVPTEQQIVWWRDGLLDMLHEESEDWLYTHQNYGPAGDICNRYRSVCDVIRNADPEVIAIEFARCWQERPSDATDWTRLGKERQRLASEAYTASKKKLIGAPSELDFNRDNIAKLANNMPQKAQAEIVPGPDDMTF
jgi:hypothetical protein